MITKKKYRPNYRIRKAYWTAFVVSMSYVRLSFFSKFAGKAYYEARITNLHLRNAERIKVAILELEGLFIKVGQLLSILSNFLPESFQAPLEALQDQIPARPYAEIEKRIEDELGAKPEEIFLEFDKTPLAAASIGQVHRALLKDNTAVVVKVQHVNIEEIADVDLKVMKQLVNLASRFFKIKGMEYAYTQVETMIREELDFTREAASMQAVAENLKEVEGVNIPQVQGEFSTARVLTSTFCAGVKINQLAQIKEWDIDLHELGTRLVEVFCKMVFVDGFYHADPHPGNILVQEDGSLVLLDFGATGSLQPAMREGFLKLIEAAAKNDEEKIIEALIALGFIPNDRASEKIAEKVITAFRNFLQNEVEFDGLNFKNLKVNPLQSSLFNLISEIGFQGIANTVQVPKDYVLLNRMATLLLGICNTLDPHINPIEVLRPYFQSFVLGGKEEMVQFIKGIFQETATTLLSIPTDFRQVLNKAKRGELELQIPSEQQKIKLFYSMGQQLIFSLLLVAALGFAYLFHQSEAPTLTNWCLGASGLFTFLFLRAWKGARQAARS